MSLALRNLYEIKRNCAMWQVRLKQSGKVVYQSCIRANCVDWLDKNFPENESE